MNIRPDAQLAEDLRRFSEDTGRPQSTIVLEATREYIDRRTRAARLDQIAANVASRHSGLLKRLGET